MFKTQNFFLMWTILKYVLIIIILLLFYILVCWLQVCGILAPQLGIESASVALEVQSQPLDFQGSSFETFLIHSLLYSLITNCF